jgi:tRNA pseudouridine55 synthase
MDPKSAEMNGVVNFLKPAGMSSHDAVAFFRRVSGARRVGHTGTLDPMAVGVLPLCVGKGARIVEYLALDRKRYRCEMRLGLTTDTQDVWGRVLSEAESDFAAHLAAEPIMETAAAFVGARMQTPPAYSAVKVDGKRLYAYARAGEPVAAPARRVEFFAIDVKRIDLARGLVAFDAECSKGAYIRTLCHDMGLALGCGAAMSGLIRTASGVFALEDSLTPEELSEAFSSGAPPENILTAIDVPLRDFSAVTLSAEESRAFINGVRVGLVSFALSAPRRADTKDSRDLRRVYGEAGGLRDVFLGVGCVDAGVLRADKVFFGAT